MGKITIFTVLLFVTSVILTDACDTDQTQRGCRIFNAQCSCGYGCKSEYRYDSMEDCRLALRGNRSNKCDKPNRCLNDGICTQISKSPEFECRCGGTGFYGRLCEKPCPKSGINNNHIPSECVVI